MVIKEEKNNTVKQLTDKDRVEKLISSGYLALLAKAYDRCYHRGAFVKHVLITMCNYKIVDVREGARKAIEVLEF